MLYQNAKRASFDDPRYSSAVRRLKGLADGHTGRSADMDAYPACDCHDVQLNHFI